MKKLQIIKKTLEKTLEKKAGKSIGKRKAMPYR